MGVAKIFREEKLQQVKWTISATFLLTLFANAWAVQAENPGNLKDSCYEGEELSRVISNILVMGR